MPFIFLNCLNHYPPDKRNYSGEEESHGNRQKGGYGGPFQTFSLLVNSEYSGTAGVVYQAEKHKVYSSQ